MDGALCPITGFVSKLQELFSLLLFFPVFSKDIIYIRRFEDEPTVLKRLGVHCFCCLAISHLPEED